MKNFLRRVFAAVSLAVVSCAGLAATAQDTLDFARDVQPILAKHCYACHGPDEAEGGLRFSDQDAVMAELDSGAHAVVAGDPESSEIMVRVASDDEFMRMPPEGDPLSEEQIAVLRRWIEEGAVWSEHWGFSEPRVVDPPEVDDPQWANNPIDAFIFAKLQQAGIEPNGAADRRELLRRASYDLTGLPPTADEIEAFVNDPDPHAFEKQIDRLLESPHYGERWGRHWLDLVRYAETNSFERDGAKPDAWKYRDYVIRSFNEDKPYDQFIREQIAGDELDEVTPESMTATGFYRLGIWDDEPADPLQRRSDEFNDIVATIGQAFLGLTIDCARCHDHKIDPIPQKDYYSMVAFVADVTPYDNGANVSYDISPPELKDQYARLHREIEEADAARREIEQRGIVKMPAEDQRATETDQRERVLRRKLKDFLSEEDWQQREQLRNLAREKRDELAALPPRESVLSVARAQAHPEPTHLLFRGNPHSPTDEVQPDFPALFERDPPQIPAPGEGARSAGRRRVLADWIASPENRMTARVMANRVWQFHFGRGIVLSSNNFGQLGTPPTHPELLDWLGAQLVDGGWRLKSLHRLIMTSRTYQMASTHNPEAAAVDPANDLFWRFDMRRLSAEEVRDSLLAVNGSLNPKVYGPSFYEALSQEVLAGQSVPGKGWGDSSPEERNRRSVYIHVKRSLVTPLLAAFDFPESDLSCEARFATLQPGQALSLMNGDFANEQAGRLAQVVTAESADVETQIQSAIRRVLAREATDEEIADGRALIDRLRNQYGKEPDEALRLYCLTLLNWNEFLFID